MVLVTNGRLITRDSEGKGYYEHGAVAYEGAKIVEVGEEAALRAKYADAEIVDAKGGVIMPAFINAHTHIYSALARGLSIVGNNPTNFYEVLDGTWWAIDRHLMMDGTRASATALYIDSIKQGVTTIFDHHASYGEIPGTLFTISEESRRLGLRSCLCYEVSDRDGEEKCLQAIKENADFITYCQKQNDPMLAAMFGGHALFTISDKTFDRMVEANNGRTGYHIHVSEGMNDVYDSLQNYVMSRELLTRHPDIKKYTTIWMDTIRNGAFGLSNTNKLIRFYPGATGLKTGFTSGAGYCLSATAQREGMELIAVTMGCESAKIRNAACKQLLDYGFANFALVSPDLEDVPSIPVVLGKEKDVSLELSGARQLLIPKAKKAGITQSVSLEESVNAPVEKGAVLGTLTVKSGGETLLEIPLSAAKAVEKLTFGDVFLMVLKRAAMAKEDA